MRCFLPPPETRFYAGIDLHARSLFLAVLDRDGHERLALNLPAAPAPFLKALQPFRDGLVVGCECVHCWYWLADACRDEGIAFALGHAWAMRAVHGSKTKCEVGKGVRNLFGAGSEKEAFLAFRPKGGTQGVIAPNATNPRQSLSPLALRR
jgi:hypothetical protein